MSPAQYEPRRAIRLIFEYDGENVRLVKEQAVEMVVAETDPGTERAAGYYLDARDAAGRTLTRVAARGAFGRTAEVFPERHEDLIQRVDVQQPRGAFTVTVPSLEAADHVAIVRVVEPSDRDAGVERARSGVVDIATFKLGTK